MGEKNEGETPILVASATDASSVLTTEPFFALAASATILLFFLLL